MFRLYLITFLFAGITSPSLAGEFYIANNGSDTNPGTIGLPFASLDRAQQAVSPGDTVWIRGGVYEFTGGPTSNPNAVVFYKSGTPGQRINYWAMPGEQPIFDFFNYKPNARIDGFNVKSNSLHFKGLELRGVQQTEQQASAGIRIEAYLLSLTGLPMEKLKPSGIIAFRWLFDGIAPFILLILFS